MPKLVHSHSPRKETRSSQRCFFVFLLLFITGSGYLLYSYILHDANSPLCTCIVCTFNHEPEEGDMLYNRYLPVISGCWFCLLFIIRHIAHRHK